MTFRQINQAALADDDALSSAIGRYIADGLAEAALVRRRGASACWDVRAAPIACGVPHGAAAMGRGCAAFLWRKVEGDTELEIDVRHSAEGGTVTLGACTQRYDDWARGRPCPRSEVTDTASGGKTTTTLGPLDVTSYRPDELIVVWVTWLSEVVTADAEELETSGGATALSTWLPREILLAGADHWNGTGTPAFGSEIAPYLIEFVSGASGAAASYDTNRDPYNLPDGRLALRFNDVKRDAIFVWPMLPHELAGSYSVGSSDWIRRTPLAHSLLYSVTLRVSDAEAPPGYGAAFDSYARAAVGPAQRLYTQGEAVFRLPTRVHAVAPAPDPSDNDTNGAFGDADRYTTFGTATGSMTRIASALVGHGDRYLTPEGDARYRVRYRVTALLAPVIRGAEGGDYHADLVFDVQLAGFDGTSGVTSDEVSYPGVRPFVAQSNGGLEISSSVGNWVAFTGENAEWDWSRHTLRGLWPEGRTGALGRGLLRVDLEVLDTETVERRRLTLRGKLGATTSLPGRYPLRLYVVGLYVDDAPETDDALIGA